MATSIGKGSLGGEHTMCKDVYRSAKAKAAQYNYFTRGGTVQVQSVENPISILPSFQYLWMDLLLHLKSILVLSIQIHDLITQSRFLHCFLEVGQRRQKQIIVAAISYQLIDHRNTSGVLTHSVSGLSNPD